MAEDIERQKQEVINKFNNMMKQNKGIEPEMIKKLFPDDEEFYNRVKEIKNKEKEIAEQDKLQNEEKKNKKSNRKNTKKKSDENNENNNIEGYQDN